MKRYIAVNNYNLVRVVNSVSSGTTMSGIAELGTSHAERGEHFTELEVISASPTQEAWKAGDILLAWDTALHPFTSPDGEDVIHMVRNEDVMFKESK